MKKQLTAKWLFLSIIATSAVSFTNQLLAAGYQLWEQDGASIGNYHAGRAAIAEDASTAFYNPAGLVRIPNQEIVLGVVPIMTGIQFRGTVETSTLGTGAVPTTVQGGTYNTVPNLHYAIPIAETLTFGLSLVSPFGLDVNYGSSTNMQYALMLASLKVVDLAPALGMKITDHWSFGVGVDIEHANAEFDAVATAFSSANDTISHNTGSSSGLGYHAGILYQCNPRTRIGLSYQSKIIHHIHGSSQFVGPLATTISPGTSNNVVGESLRINVPLPATSTLSFFQTLDKVWDVMVSVSYTQWNILRSLIVQEVVGTTGNVDVDSPQKFINTWNIAAGANYHLNDQVMFRAGFGLDQSPANNQYRTVSLPDSNRYIFAVGVHYQATKAVSCDLGWTHLTAINAKINNPPDILGAQVDNTLGTVESNADVYGFQVKWDIV